MKLEKPEDRRSRTHTLVLASCALAALASPHLPAQQPYELDADTVALYHFDVETVTPQLKRMTPDSGPYGLHGVLEGDVLPAHVPAVTAGLGWAYQFDGVDRANNSRINMGTDQALGFRGNSDWTLDVVVTVGEPVSHDGWYRGIVCRTGGSNIDYSLSYASYSTAQWGPEHAFWFSTGVNNGTLATTEYAYTAVTLPGFLEVGMRYAIRVIVKNGVMEIFVNGLTGTVAVDHNGPWTPKPGLVPPDAAPFPGELTVGDACPADYVTLPSELQIEELRISTVARTDSLIEPSTP